ncbi:uncharacterized protein LOC126761812 [Bactrocera neohumeralis]|uniref:uncharacterized protein LOC120778538 n=1 Tax=Bactrocera tryoni TaxID=59916 RepID=UPI001A97E373|nr:uncharacterized protein LOC120778538 [Bactrocera tryoni]XP_050334175.1 uncharacterized protein LOC126761812 [Bactrocera neohumeralis]
MAILLVHLRRLILLMSIVYLSGTVMRRLLSESRHNYLQHINGKAFAARHLHFQAWAYIYTAYAYVVLVNYVSVRRLTNLLEFFLT